MFRNCLRIVLLHRARYQICFVGRDVTDIITESNRIAPVIGNYDND